MKIELENLFVQKLKDGINLFTGAGFSTLQSPNGEKLPTGKELSCELKKKYSLTDIPEDQELSYVSEFCPDQEYQEYLRERLKVKSYNPLYNVLNKINLKPFQCRTYLYLTAVFATYRQRPRLLLRGDSVSVRQVLSCAESL